MISFSNIDIYGEKIFGAAPRLVISLVIDGVPYTGQRQINGKAVQLTRNGRALQLEIEEIEGQLDGPWKILQVFEDFYADQAAGDQVLSAGETLALFAQGSVVHLASSDAAQTGLPQWGTLVAEGAPFSGSDSVMSDVISTSENIAVVSKSLVPQFSPWLLGGLGFVALSVGGGNNGSLDSKSDDAGSIATTGMATQGQVLTAGEIIDADGGVTGVTYQWKANGTDIGGATNSTFTLTQAQVGQVITVVASYTDNHGSGKSVTSSPTVAVANVNDAATGTVTISGVAEEGGTLTVVTSGVTDPDGTELTLVYQWQIANTEGGEYSNIDGATEGTYQIANDQSQVGKFFKVLITATNDGTPGGTVFTSAATSAVVQVADAPAAQISAILSTLITNKLLYSQQFDHGSWRKTGVTVTRDTNEAPDGSFTADSVDFASMNSLLYQQVPNQSIAAGQSYTSSIFTKTASRVIVFGGATPAGTDTYSIVDVGNGWYRQNLTRVFSSTSTGNVQFVIVPIDAPTMTSLQIWGAQLQEGVGVTGYVASTSAEATADDVVGTSELLSGFGLSVSGLMGVQAGDRVQVVDANGTVVAISGHLIENQTQVNINVKDISDPLLRMLDDGSHVLRVRLINELGIFGAGSAESAGIHVETRNSILINVEDFRVGPMSDMETLDAMMDYVHKKTTNDTEVEIVFENGRTYTYTDEIAVGERSNISFNLNGATLRRADYIETSANLEQSIDPSRNIILVDRISDNWSVGDYLLVSDGPGMTNSASDARKIISLDFENNSVTLESGFINSFNEGSILNKRFAAISGRPSSPDSTSPYAAGVNENINIFGGVIDGNADGQSNFSWRLLSEIAITGKNSSIYSMDIINTGGEAIVGHGLTIRNNRFYNLGGSAFHTSVHDDSVSLISRSAFYENIVENANMKGNVINGHSEGVITFSWGGGYLDVFRNYIKSSREYLLGDFGPSSGSNKDISLNVYDNVVADVRGLFYQINPAANYVNVENNILSDFGLIHSQEIDVLNLATNDFSENVLFGGLLPESSGSSNQNFLHEGYMYSDVEKLIDSNFSIEAAHIFSFENNTVTVELLGANIWASAGDDTVIIRTDNVKIYGGTGADVFLIDHAGNNFFVGGDGRDIFRYANAVEGRDVISDFQVGNFGDILDISALLSGFQTNIHDIFDWVAYKNDGAGKVLLEIDRDGMGVDAIVSKIILFNMDYNNFNFHSFINENMVLV